MLVERTRRVALFIRVTMLALGHVSVTRHAGAQTPTLAPRPSSTVGQVALANSQEYTLQSKINGRTYRILVALPLGYHEGSPADTTRYPVFFALDGEIELPLMAGMFRLTNRGRDGTGAVVDSIVQDAIFVGVGYPPGADPYAAPPGGGQPPFRARDYSPPPFPASNPDHKNWQSEQPWAGGAPAFLRVLKEELIPLIDRRYRTTSDRSIHGHSMGGLFVAYVLFTDPDLFSRYAMTSPSLWWDGGSIHLRAADLAKRTTSLRKRVFIDVGGLEGADQISEVMRMVSTLCQGIGAGRFAGMKLTAEVLPDEYHSSSVHFARALKALYPPFAADAATYRDPCPGR